MMKKTVCATTGLAAALAFSPLAGADPTVGHYTNVVTQSPSMLCTIGSDDATPGIGPNVVCQVSGDGFPALPLDWAFATHPNQAVVTAAGEFKYRGANIATTGDDFNPVTLTDGSTYHFEGWTTTPTTDGVTFTNDATGHGMTIDANLGVKSF
jgi:hypothetical protein